MADTVIDFIRHGEPQGGRRYRGSGIDDPLTDKGWQQMWASAGEHIPWTQVITSPLQRCQAFARALSEKHGIPVISDPRFREVGFGAWEGLSPDEIIEQQADAYREFYADPVHNRPPGAENLLVFAQRVANAFEDIVHLHTKEHVLVVAHAGVIRAALGHVMQAAPAAWYRARIDHAAITRFRHGQYGYQLDFHNHITTG